MESKVIRLLSIIHNGIILDLVAGFFSSVRSVLSSLVSTGRNFPSPYSLLLASRGSSREPSLLILFSGVPSASQDP